MLIVCQEGLSRPDFERLAGKLSALGRELRWGRRAGRLVFHIEHVRGDQDDLTAVTDDPSVDYVLRDPTKREIARILTRRDLLDFSLVATGCLTAFAFLAPLGAFLAAPVAERSRQAGLPLGNADAIPVNGSRTKLIDGEEFIVVRRDEKHFHALSATCTHSEICLVQWDPKRRQLICPCHRGTFDLYGNVLSGPPPRPLRRLDVVVESDGTLYVRQART